MKRLTTHAINAVDARRQLTEYQALLAAKPELSEQDDVLPFFRTNPDLCLLFSHYIPAIKNADVLATEFQIYGDFRADLIVGDSANAKYLLVEFEDGRPGSIFRAGSKAAPDWAPRFEGAFSQLVDWLWKLEDMRVTNDFAHVFGRRDAKFSGLIVIGKNMNLGSQELNRLRWREDKIQVDSKPVSVVSYEDFSTDADEWLRRFHRA